MKDKDDSSKVYGRVKQAPATIIVIFGASGDLTKRKLIPAIYNLSFDDLLPEDFYLIGYGRKEIADDAFCDMSTKAVEAFSRRELDADKWDNRASKIQYHQGGYDDLASYKSLAERISSIENSLGKPLQLICYISTPQNAFKPILENLGESGIAKRHADSAIATKVIVEKPFGHDLTSAKDLNATISRYFAESQVFRIDHYLGKETVQDLLVQRFANSIFEPIWNRQYINNVQITVAEDLGVGTRGGYYEQSGALRDMIQNHTMQLLALVAMEPPVSLDPESIRDEKVKVLKAIQPLNLDGDKGDVIRAQYEAGLINDEKANGYLEEKDIAPDSSTETFAAAKLMINNWRWKGVPFYLRSGKRMEKRVSEIAIQFKRPPGILFGEESKFKIAPNTIFLRIQPDEGMTLLLNAKKPGLETKMEPVKMNFQYATAFGSNTPEAYERLILDAMVGDSTLFIRSDETEASWGIFSPVLDYWKECGQSGMESYTAGSWGPLASEQLLWKDRHKWWDIQD
tara:strand:- start:422 stop:1963 length:1542 start_codon:yes stop_codon:yes gene_type:complete